MSFQAQAAHFRFSPDSRHIAASRRPNRLTHDEARRLAVNFAELPELLRYLVAADERGVRWLEPHIHDSPRKFRLALNSGRVVATTALVPAAESTTRKSVSRINCSAPGRHT
jgi:hypothetical protein